LNLNTQNLWLISDLHQLAEAELSTYFLHSIAGSKTKEIKDIRSKVSNVQVITGNVK